MESGNKMNTLSEVIGLLRQKGYEENFEMGNEGFTAKISGLVLSPENIKIRKVFRFEGESNPGDMSVLYAMETDKGVKGILIDAYGTYAGNENGALAEFLKKVIIEEKSL